MQFLSSNTRPWLAGLGLLLVPLAASAQATLTSNGGTLFVNTGGTFTVNGDLNQTGAALLRTTGTATVAGSLTGAATSTLDLSTGLLDVTRDVTHAGSLAGSTGTLRLSGGTSAALRLAGGTVPNLTIDKVAGAVALGQPLRVRRVLNLANAGRLSTNRQALTLLSDASGTALLANTGAGQVVGSLTVQRYLDGSRNPGLGYRHLAAPVIDETVAAFGSGGTAPVVNAAYNTAAQPGAVSPFPTVFYYDQARLATSPATGGLAFDKGWASPADLTDAAPQGTQGFTVQLPGGQTLAFVGEAVQGARAIALARDAGPTAADAGWNFIGNPYAAPLDWSAVTASQRPNVDAAMYVFESTSQYGGQYRSYANGVGASPLIGSSQGFWVRVSAGQTSGTLALDNSHRITDYARQAPVRRSTADVRPLVQLTLAGAGATDDLYAYAEAGATASADKEFDAVRMANSTGLNLASFAATGQQLAIDGRPAFTAATVLPLAVGVPVAGTYTLTATTINNLPAGLTAYLRDAQTGTLTALTAGTNYSFSVTAAQASALIAGRFTLQFSGAALAATPAALAAQVQLFPNPAREQATLLVPGIAGASAVQAELLNSLGQVMLRQQAPLPAAGAQLVLPTATLATGVYTVRLRAGSVVLTKRLTVQ
ncbi:T9SS type A sorting domain-containing protein [Hymenobacter sp. M29]|uniref:T9SS type A sorting domain-containing protein n=1 Tax=Hymenobacter mellowenesis TaxID=3063995 RepID=A0ABT9AG21_9BACT|nr:T9SS type A sorting domain-containing protein [Hymenobacter sp. M29]MDO7848818.1 T9SS type A sorting domain-containing protein [Hymenobacter sp. M29]